MLQKSTLFSICIAFICGYAFSSFLNRPTGTQVLSSKTPPLAQQPSATLDNWIESVQSSTAQQTIDEDEVQYLKQALERASDEKISSYLKQVFKEQDLEHIQDKRRFAERLLDEISSEPTPSAELSGELFLSTTPAHTPSNTPIHEVHRHQYLYAHFDTFGDVVNNTQIFIKWMHQQNKEVILFRPQSINRESSQNWVSALPEKGWAIGSYIVQVYDMEDQLRPIAQKQYTIERILD